jgi:hypothetical protein
MTTPRTDRVISPGIGPLSDTSLSQAAQGEHPSRISRDHWLAGLLTVTLAVFYILAQSWAQDLRAASTDILVIAIAAACSLLGLLLVRKWGFEGKFGVAHFGLSLAVFLWFLGMTVWGIYEVVLHVDVPYPSIADVFYLAGYLPAFIGMEQFLWFFRKAFTPGKVAVAALSGLAIVFTSSVVLLYPLITESADILTKFFDVVYPSLDTLLIVFALMMAVILRNSRFANDWLWIALGLLLWGTGDIAFCYGTLLGWYYSGHPIGLFWLYGYLALSLGFSDQRRSLTQLIRGSSPPVLSHIVFRCVDATLAEVLGVTIRDALYFKEGRRAQELSSHIKSLSAILEENLGPELTRIILLAAARRLSSELHVAFVERPNFDLVDYIEETKSIIPPVRNA